MTATKYNTICEGMLNMKKLLCVMVVLVAAACAISSTGTAIVDGRPAKIELVEYIPNGITLDGYDIKINSEFVGRVMRKEILNRFTSNPSMTFTTVQTKYGVIGLTQNYSNMRLSLDITIDGKYLGSIQK